VLEILLAAFIPLIAAWLAVRRFGDPEMRRAATLFVVLTAIWTAPLWLTGSSPVAFDYLTESAPWKHLRPPNVLMKNPLLNDIPLQILPWRESVRQLAFEGRPPVFDPQSGVAAPLWANPQALVLWPFTWLGIPFSSFAWPVFMATCKLLIGLFATYVFLKGLQLSQEASCFDPESGWIAIGETALKYSGANGEYDWLRPYRPARRVGKSIRLYHIPSRPDEPAFQE
jgi:hypothetical protein